MAESSSAHVEHSRSSVSNEHLLFVETLRNWRDPLLHGHEPLPLLLCPRCVTCKCESLKDLRHTSTHFIQHHTHQAACPKFRQSSDRTRSSFRQRMTMKPVRRAISHDPSISLHPTSKSLSKIPIRISTSSSLSSSSNHLQYSSSHKTKIPRLIRTPPSPTRTTRDDSYEVDSLNEELYQTPTIMSDHEGIISKRRQEQMDQTLLMARKKKKQQRRYRYREGRPSKSRATSNDLSPCSSSSSSSSSSSHSIVPLRRKSHSNRPTSQRSSSLSDDSLSEKPRPRPSRSRTTYSSTSFLLTTQHPSMPPTDSFGLTKTDTSTWENELDENELYPRYSIEEFPSNLTHSQRSSAISPRLITLQRGQMDYWENCSASSERIISSSCDHSIGSASRLVSSSYETPGNIHGQIISISTTKRQQPSLLNQSKNTQWNIDETRQQIRYSKIQSLHDDPLQKSLSSTSNPDSPNEPKNDSKPVLDESHQDLENIPMDTNDHQTDSIVPQLVSSKPVSYASTDEDVDELNSHYSDVLDRSSSTIQNAREKSNPDSLIDSNEINRNLISRPRILSTEHSQITFDSGVDILSEQKIYQPNQTFTIDEQSSEETTDQNDLFALSDDSVIDIRSKSPRNSLILHANDHSHSIYFSAKSDVNIEKDPYAGFELETIPDEDDDQPQVIGDQCDELLITSEHSPPTPNSTRIPSQFEFKLPSFGEWIDRVFTTFLTETNQNQSSSFGSSRSSSINSIHSSQSTINTSSSQMTTVMENPNFQNLPLPSRVEEQNDNDDEHSLNDMSSSSLNYEEKVDFDTYIINSNYEKINPSGTNEEILFINERSKSLLSPITSSIAIADQEMMNNERISNEMNDQIECQYPSNSHDSLLQSDLHHFNSTTLTTTIVDDLTRTNQTFHSKDSALGLSDENLNHISSNALTHLEQDEQIPSCSLLEDKMIENSDTSMDGWTIDDPIQKMSTIDELERNDEHDQRNERTISSSSSEQLIPKEKQTGMYYPAFGSAAALHLAEQYRCEWLAENCPNTPEDKPSEFDDHLRIVHQCQTLGDNEDEFYFSPQTLHSSYSCPNLFSNPNAIFFEQQLQHSYSLTTLDAYTHLNITQETLEQIWLSLLDVAFSERDDRELDEYKLRHLIGLSNSSSHIHQNHFIEKSRSHNDVFTLLPKHNQKSLTKMKSKSFDITSLIKHSSSFIPESTNMGLLQGADISEPFADRLISTSIHSDLESIRSFEPESISRETPPPPSVPSMAKEPLDYVFNFSSNINAEEFDFNLDENSLNLPLTFDTDDLPPPMLPVQDTYTELSLFRPHSLSTIPSSRASQYASSVDSDEIFDRERHMHKENSEENHPYHISDDDHGVIGSEFSSPQSRPLSSIQSRPFSPEQNAHKPMNFSEIDYEAWKRAIDEQEEMIHNDQFSSIIPIEFSDDTQDIYLLDQIEPISLSNQISQEYFIEPISNDRHDPILRQDYLTIEPPTEVYLDPTDLSQRLEQLDSSFKEDIIDPSESISTPLPHPPVRYSTHHVDKVSDLEIVKKGNNFKIGYVDRQGVEPRVILTKRITAGPDILERDPQVRLPYKGRRILNQIFSSVLYTNGYNHLQEDKNFEYLADEKEVPIIGTNPKHFDESDMISIDIDGPSTMLHSICESIVITQGSVFSKPSSNQTTEQPICTSESIKKDKIEVVDSWHDRRVIHGNSNHWRSPAKPPKSSPQIKQERTTRDIALSPIPLITEQYSQTMSTPPMTVDRSCQYSPPIPNDRGSQCCLEKIHSTELSTSLRNLNENPSIRALLALERSADSGILADDHHRLRTHLALQVDIKSLSSDSEDTSELTSRPVDIHTNGNGHLLTTEIEQEIVQLRRERAHVLDLLALNWSRSNIWVELTEAKLNYIIGETDALLRSISFDPSPIDNETIKSKMHQYEEDMAELTRQHLAVYRERLEDSKRQLDVKINQLELKKSSLENQTIDHQSPIDQFPRLLTSKRSKSFLSTSAGNLTIIPMEESLESHPQLLDISFLTSNHSDQRVNSQETLYRPTTRYPSKNLSNMEGLSQSQQAIIDETDELVKDSQQLHNESASQFERARESLLSSETSIRLARANLAASRSSERKTYLPNDVTLAELFKYEQSLAKEAAKSNRHIYSTTEF